jgi:hypothetical protein
LTAHVARLPFVCSKCGFSWGNEQGPGLLSVSTRGDEATTVKFNDITMTCPRCRHVNRPAIPEGEYNVHHGRWDLVRRITEDVVAAGATVEDIKHLAEVAEGLAQEEPDANKLADAIAAETPFTRLAETIRAHPNLSIFVASTIINIIVSVALALIVPTLHIGATSPALSPHQVDELAHKIAHDIEQDERHQGQRSKPAPIPGNLTRLHPQGRNEPCMCGSGIKYKKCCGGPHAKAS